MLIADQLLFVCYVTSSPSKQEADTAINHFDKHGWRNNTLPEQGELKRRLASKQQIYNRRCRFYKRINERMMKPLWCCCGSQCNKQVDFAVEAGINRQGSKSLSSSLREANIGQSRCSGMPQDILEIQPSAIYTSEVPICKSYIYSVREIHHGKLVNGKLPKALVSRASPQMALTVLVTARITHPHIVAFLS